MCWYNLHFKFLCGLFDGVCHKAAAEMIAGWRMTTASNRGDRLTRATRETSSPCSQRVNHLFFLLFMLVLKRYTWHASLWCARQTAWREVSRGSLATTGGTLWARPEDFFLFFCRLALRKALFVRECFGTEEERGWSFAWNVYDNRKTFQRGTGASLNFWPAKIQLALF